MTRVSPNVLGICNVGHEHVVRSISDKKGVL